MITTEVDKKILEVLKKAKKPMSTYLIAKHSKITWPTANSHCYKLKSMGLIGSKVEKSSHGPKEKIMWWAK
ncbi:MAG: winged helix-turn-helix domain-containing protein [Candidatus Aenigmarchaeota archaeon]|nr:winged helix-turn-helix domain-containing protein [Candidatus Aenigmarchaeota archaeon]